MQGARAPDRCKAEDTRSRPTPRAGASKRGSPIGARFPCLAGRDHTKAFAFAFTLTSAHAHMSIGSQFGQSFLQLPPLPLQNCASTEFNQCVSITSLAMSDDFAAAAPRFIDVALSGQKTYGVDADGVHEKGFAQLGADWSLIARPPDSCASFVALDVDPLGTAWAGHIHGTCARIHQHAYL